MAPNVHTLNDTPSLPPQAQSIKDRYFPGMRSCFYFNPETFNPLNRDRDDQIRRVCMIVALGSHTVIALLGLFSALFSFDILGLFVGIIAALIGFFFLTGCLARIGEAEGERIVAGRVVGRWHFDVFLMFCACIYAAALLGTLFGMGGISGFLIALVPLPMWVLVFLVAWIATWDTRPVSMA